MEALFVEPGPGIPHGLLIPAHFLHEQFAKSSGPGGQGVNTTDSKVQLSIDVAELDFLTETQRLRVLNNLAGKLVETTLTVEASEQRSQLRNRSAARLRLAGMLREALAPPPPKRRATRRSRGSIERRLASKRHRSEIKATRQRPRLP